MKQLNRQDKIRIMDKVKQNPAESGKEGGTQEELPAITWDCEQYSCIVDWQPLLL